MKTRNSCYTYFAIVGDFNPDEVSKLLNLPPDKTRKIGDLRKDGTKYDSALWQFGKCADYDVEVGNQMRKTIAPLLDKINLLNEIREKNVLSFYLAVVPQLYVNDVNPCLAPPLDVMDFCHATRTEMDIDLYLYNEKDM